MPEVQDESDQLIQSEEGENIVTEGGSTLEVKRTETVGSSGQLG